MEGDNGENEQFWRNQYGFVLNALQQEGIKFWTRFQSSLIVNGGLLSIFVAILLFFQNSDLQLTFPLNTPIWIFTAFNWVLIIIMGLGILISSIWLELTKNGAKWQGYWVNLGRDLENTNQENCEVFIFRNLRRTEDAYPTIKWSLVIPILFVISWALILSLFLYSLLQKTLLEYSSIFMS